jgi:aminobenzoyl-glutamate transport protein
MTASPSPLRRSRLLDFVERVGNRLPDPITMFLLFAVGVVVISWVASSLGVAVQHPKDGSTVAVVNLLDAAGVRRMFLEAVRNFTGFAPLGMVLVSMIGIGLAEGTGLIGVSLRAIVMSVPRSWLTATVVLVAINANQAADAAVIVLPPLAGMLFAAAGRHPLAGIAAAYAGVTGGFSANLMPATLDLMLAGLSQEAVDASKLLVGYKVQLLGNWYFLAVSTPLLTLVGTWVTTRWIEPRLGPWKTQETATADTLSPDERRGLRWAFAALGVTLALAATVTLLPGAPLYESGAPTLLGRIRPFLDSLVVWVVLLFFVPGLAFGIATRKIRGDRDLAKLTGDAMATMGSYIVLAFVAAQFLSYFAWSNLGAVLAISGANLLKSIGLQGAPLLVGLVLLVAGINLFVTSASAKWAIMAPIFVPMFVLLGFSPEATQLTFRIGDSCTNIITPIFVYLPFIQSYMTRYDPTAGTGTIISLMLPYSLAFLPMWTLQLLIFYWLGWPIGPGVGIPLAH